MMKKTIFILLLSSFSIIYANAQYEVSYGIKAGLSFSTIMGESETDANGNSLENNKFYTGFHAGIVVNVPFNDQFGVAPELLYNMRGTKYRFEGQGFMNLMTELGVNFNQIGIRKEVYTANLFYLDIPVLFYYAPVERFKILVGPHIGILAGATGSGETTLSFVDGTGTAQDIIIELDYNYNRDKAGEAKSDELSSLTINSGGAVISYPSIIGAHYFDSMDDGRFFNTLDLGINGGFRFNLTRGISTEFRASYSFIDATNNDYDFSKVTPDTPRKDKDNSLSFQVSLGFNF